jgi:acyl carrier protein
MTRTEVFQRLQTIFDDVFLEPVVVTPTLTAREVEGWDSVQHISLMLAVEGALGIRFNVGEIESARNVGELADLILKHLSEGAKLA